MLIQNNLKVFMLLVLHPYKFNQHYYFEYEFDLFEKKLFSKFEIHDLSQIFSELIACLLYRMEWLLSGIYKKRRQYNYFK